MPGFRYMEGIGSAAILATKRLAGVTTRGESKGMCNICMLLPSMNMALALKPKGDITRSPKQGYLWSQKRTYALQFLKKKINLC